MMKCTLILMCLLILPIAIALEECPRYASPQDIPCEVRSTWKPSTGCMGGLDYYNESGIEVFNTSWTDLPPYCKANFNYTSIGTVCGNSTIDDSCITIQGENDNMILAISLFLILLNALIFALPFWVTFSKSEAANYVVRRMMWMAAILLLWFNTTLFRQLASDWGLGIDNFLLVYWWVFTLGAFATIFIMCYVMVVGAMKLMKESKLKERMGEYEY